MDSKLAEDLYFVNDTIGTCIVRNNLKGTDNHVVGLYRLHSVTISNFNLVKKSSLINSRLTNIVCTHIDDSNIILLSESNNFLHCSLFS